jgi:hypothetical protein
VANFKTHIAAGTIVSGTLATLTLAADVVDPQSLIAVTLAGVVGSILPDIDLKDSRPSTALFAGLAIFFSFAVLFCAAPHYSIAELWILWLGTLVGVRYGVHAVFHAIAVHRGVWHSLLATVFCALATALAFKHVLGFGDGVAWLGAGFLAVGYLTHLVLDEAYSVDVMDTRIKASFGTALKLADFNNPRHSGVMAVGTVILALMAPPVGDFVAGLSSERMWASVQQRLLPRETWFGVIRVARADATVVPSATSEPGRQTYGAPTSGVLTSGVLASGVLASGVLTSGVLASGVPTSTPIETGSLPPR